MIAVGRANAGVFAACSTLLITIFGPYPIVVHGTPEQQAEWLSPLIGGEDARPPHAYTTHSADSRRDWRQVGNARLNP